LNHNDLELCTNFGVDAPKPGSKDKFYVSLVVRPELVDTPVTIILKKGIRAEEAKEALGYVAEIIGDANKAAYRAKTAKHVAKAGWFHRYVVYAGAGLVALFHLPGAAIDWLTGHLPKF
jgi:hypothetical protein